MHAPHTQLNSTGTITTTKLNNTMKVTKYIFVSLSLCGPFKTNITEYLHTFFGFQTSIVINNKSKNPINKIVQSLPMYDVLLLKKHNFDLAHFKQIISYFSTNNDDSDMPPIPPDSAAILANYDIKLILLDFLGGVDVDSLAFQDLYFCDLQESLVNKRRFKSEEQIYEIIEWNEQSYKELQRVNFLDGDDGFNRIVLRYASSLEGDVPATRIMFDYLKCTMQALYYLFPELVLDMLSDEEILEIADSMTITG